MRRITFETYSAAFAMGYVCLVTNVLLVVGSFPLVLLLVATDPARSWPLIAASVPLAAPSACAAFTVFRRQLEGGTDVVRTFRAEWKASARRSLQLAGLATAIVVVLLVDGRFLAGGSAGVVVIPALAVTAGIVTVVLPVALVAVSERPGARLTTLLRVCAYLALRRWPGSVATVAVFVVQFAVFASAPAIALGITAAPALYVAWANGRYVLAPALVSTGTTDRPTP